MSWVATRGGGRGTSTARRRACCTAQGRPARPFLPLDLSFPVCTIRELNKKKKDDPRLFSVNDLDSRPLLSRGDSAAARPREPVPEPRFSIPTHGSRGRPSRPRGL